MRSQCGPQQRTTQRVMLPEQFGRCRSHVARCLFLSQDRADTTFALNKMCHAAIVGSCAGRLERAKEFFFMEEHNQPLHAAEPGEVEEARQFFLTGQRWWGQVFSCGQTSTSVATYPDSDWAGLQRVTKVLKCRCGPGQSRVKSIHTHATCHCYRQNCTLRHWEHQIQQESSR